MAHITLEELIGHLGRFQQTTTEQCLAMLKEEIPIGLTGNMYENTEILSMGKDYSIIGVNEAKVPYTQAVLNGRGPVRPVKRRSTINPKHAHSLGWEDYDGSGTSIHHGTPKKMVYRMYAGPAQGNDFISRTREKILSADLDVGGFRGWARRITRPLRNRRR